MPETVAYVTSVVVTAGPKVSFTETLTVEAYNRLSIPVTKGASQKVFLGTADSEIRLLLIKSSKYDAALVTFTIQSATIERVLDMPFLAAGKAAVSLLAAASPTFLTFKNGLTEDILIDILIARDPTP